MRLSRQILDELLAEAKADEVGLWFVIARIRDEFGDIDVKYLKTITLQSIEDLLNTGEVVAGWSKPDRSGINRWRMRSSDVLSRISYEWDQLGRVPNIGEIAVFVGSQNDD